MNTREITAHSGASALSEQLGRIKAAGSAWELRRRLAGLWPALGQENLREVAIVGAADEGIRLAGICSALGIKVRAVGDDSPAKHGMELAGSTVGPVDLLASFDKSVPAIVASHRALKPVRRLRAMGFRVVAPFMVLQALDPVRFPPHMFHGRLLEDLSENVDRLRSLGERLADDKSRAVLAAVIAYRAEGDPESLADVIEWELYGPDSLLTYGDDEVYVDGGTFDGDTIRLFIDRVGEKFNRVIGFEPDPRTFARLKANFAAEPRVQPVNAGLHRQRATLRFDDAGTRGSVLVESGGISVPVLPLDEVLHGDRVSYIKMNIEGAELDALDGAAGSIRRWKPKLAISAYHFADHLWRVPDKIRELRHDYRLFFRQHDGGIIETVAYGLPPA